MCTNKEDATSAVNSGDVKITINKQQKIGTCNRGGADNPSLDFRIQTNIEFVTNKKLKICLLINILITVLCIGACFLVSYKLYSDLLQLQQEVISLNGRLQFLSKRCEDEDNDLERPKPLPSDPQAHTMERADVKDGTLAAHFKGMLPEINMKDQGLVGPWFLDNSASKQYKFPKFHLTEGQYSIEVTEPALYFIYAQVYYITSSAINSYTMYVRSEGSSDNNVIAKCSAAGPNNNWHASEISCYTSAVHSLKANDRVFIQQTEKNRTIILRDGNSFFGLVRLNNSLRNK